MTEAEHYSLLKKSFPWHMAQSIARDTAEAERIAAENARRLYLGILASNVDDYHVTTMGSCVFKDGSGLEFRIEREHHLSDYVDINIKFGMSWDEWDAFVNSVQKAREKGSAP